MLQGHPLELFDWYHDPCVFLKGVKTFHREAAKQRDNASIKETGAVYTLPSIVSFMLDLMGYTCDKNLALKPLLEPSFGAGDFLAEIVTRLIASWRKHNSTPWVQIEQLRASLCAVELNTHSFHATKLRLHGILLKCSVPAPIAEELLCSWLIHDDFLLASIPRKFDFVIGNPPYVRQERISAQLTQVYRKLYHSFIDRADLYIPFFERSLRLLNPQGKLNFICSNRWMKNKYGRVLRKTISVNYHVSACVDATGVNPFTSSVIAYPSITLIENTLPKQKTSTIRLISTEKKQLDRDVLDIKKGGHLSSFYLPSSSDEPWLLNAAPHLELIRYIESHFPSIESTACKVGIGVATGADGIFIQPFNSFPIESHLKLPLLTTKDIRGNEISWGGHAVLNPFRDDGTLVSLEEHPLLHKYLLQHEERILARHCAKKSPEKWYRTIDRIYSDLQATPKLLIPDISRSISVAYDEGDYYPHHNLYYITAKKWHLLALKAVLISNITHAFISAYSTKMQGGCLRFQAQYLRRVCLPAWDDIPANLQSALVIAGSTSDIAEANYLMPTLFSIPNRLLSHLTLNIHEQ